MLLPRRKVRDGFRHALLMPGFVFVSLPAPRGEKYAFSIPVSDLYSLLVYPVSAIREALSDMLAKPAALVWLGDLQSGRRSIFAYALFP